MVKSMCCSCRRPRFDSRHPYSASQPSAVPGHLTPSLTSEHQACLRSICVHSGKALTQNKRCRLNFVKSWFAVKGVKHTNKLRWRCAQEQSLTLLFLPLGCGAGPRLEWRSSYLLPGKACQSFIGRPTPRPKQQ